MDRSGSLVSYDVMGAETLKAPPSSRPYHPPRFPERPVKSGDVLAAFLRGF